MLRNNLKIAWRSLLKHKLQTGINIIGLAIGIAGCFVIFLLARYELGFNKEITDSDRIYRVYTQYKWTVCRCKSRHSFWCPLPWLQVFCKELKVQSFMRNYTANVRIPNEAESAMRKLERQKDIVIAGPSYF